MVGRTSETGDVIDGADDIADERGSTEEASAEALVGPCGRTVSEFVDGTSLDVTGVVTMLSKPPIRGGLCDSAGGDEVTAPDTAPPLGRLAPATLLDPTIGLAASDTGGTEEPLAGEPDWADIDAGDGTMLVGGTAESTLLSGVGGFSDDAWGAMLLAGCSGLILLSGLVDPIGGDIAGGAELLTSASGIDAGGAATLLGAPTEAGGLDSTTGVAISDTIGGVADDSAAGRAIDCTGEVGAADAAGAGAANDGVSSCRLAISASILLGITRASAMGNDNCRSSRRMVWAK